MRPGQRHAQMQQQMGKDRLQYYKDTGMYQAWQKGGGQDTGGIMPGVPTGANSMFGNLEAAASNPEEYNRRLLAAGEEFAGRQRQEQAMEKLLKYQNVARALGGGISINGQSDIPGLTGPKTSMNAGGQGTPLAKNVPSTRSFNNSNPFF